MIKYIQDSLRNNSRSVFSGLTRPQQKAANEVLRGLFTAGEPILRHLVQNPLLTAKRQAEKYSYHLRRMDIRQSVDDLALKKAIVSMRKHTIIAYDLTDISKKSAKKIEKISLVHDGSTGTIVNGFVLHGVGMNGILMKLQLHDGDQYTTNQIRKNIVMEISKHTHGKGIWVFDRGNDDRQFYRFLRQDAKVHFITRIRDNRKIVIKETGAVYFVRDLPEGKYTVYLMGNQHNKIDTDLEYQLVVSKHLEDKEPIRLIHSLRTSYSKHQIVMMYLERWGVENIFRRVKEKFQLEKIRVLKYRSFVTLVAIIQLAVLISTLIFFIIQRSTKDMVLGALLLYRRFLKRMNLGCTIDSFITFMKSCLKPYIPLIVKPPGQLTLFPKQGMEKLGLF